MRPIERDRAKAIIERYEIDEQQGLVRLIGHDALTGDPYEIVLAAPTVAVALREHFERTGLVRDDKSKG